VSVDKFTEVDLFSCPSGDTLRSVQTGTDVIRLNDSGPRFRFVESIRSKGTVTNLATGESLRWNSAIQLLNQNVHDRETIEVGDKFRITVSGLNFAIHKPEGGVTFVSAGHEHTVLEVVGFFELPGGETFPDFEEVRFFTTPHLEHFFNRFFEEVEPLLC
jgi:hypothetical protein